MYTDYLQIDIKKHGYVNILIKNMYTDYLQHTIKKHGYVNILIKIYTDCGCHIKHKALFVT